MDRQAEDWPVTAEDYTIQEQIGQGAFAKVWKAYCPSMRAFVAVKVMDLEKVTSNFEDIRSEVQTMKMTNHANVLTCYCSFVYKDQLWLVMPYMNKGSCLHVMSVLKKQGRGEGLKEDWIASILKETLQGLEYFHNNGQIHRDIKAGNILLDGDGRVKIADFGVSGWLMEGGDRRRNRQVGQSVDSCELLLFASSNDIGHDLRVTFKTFVGTPCWMAPEVMEQVHGYDYKADIWSFGITALELAKGYAPYARFQPMKVLLLTIQEEPPSLRSYEDSDKGASFSRHFKDMVKLCLQKDPTKRPNAATLLKHSFFKKARPTSTLVDEVLRTIDDIGESAFAPSIPENMPGTAPMFVNNEDDGKGEGATKYAPGTTWVFDDDKEKKNSRTDDDMTMDEFANEFENATGGAGEDFKKGSS